jgi:hypothetical protein
MAFVRVFAPQSESQLVVAISLLEAHGIPVFVQNRHFGSLFPGLQSNAFFKQSVMVPEERAAEATELLASLESDDSQTADVPNND